MKIARNILLGLLVLAVVIVGGGYVWLNAAYPKVSEAPDISIERTPERIERGEYLAWHVAGCVDCHSTRDFTRFAGPVVAGTIGNGGEKFGEDMGLPGDFYAPNITPTHLKDWTDGEIYRAIVSGVSKDGHPLFPIMPYPNFGRMDKEDIYAIIAYIRTLDPVENTVQKSDVKFPMNLIMRTIPSDPTHESRPSPSNKVAYGKYMITMAGCADCHTQMVKGEPVPGMDYAGGYELPLPGGTLRSANITPDTETGIGGWTEDMFVQRFRAYTDSLYVEPELGPTDFNTIMPWFLYSRMKDEDLRAIYAYLRTVKPVKNAVEHFTPKK
ncbi:MAG: c-type cytochrome [Bacteroidetes bacterium]|nr:c-type cytochrome [Bacteroidota bacterium]